MEGAIVTIIIALITFAFFLGKLSINVSSIKKSNNLIPEMRAAIDANKKVVDVSDKTLDRIDDKINRMIDKFDGIMLSKITQANSPIRLNKEGTRILKQSKIASVIQEKLEFIIEQVKTKSPKNAYQTQEYLFDVISLLKKDKALIERIENGAFLSGSDIETVLYAGVLNVRDIVIKELGFNLWDIDKEEIKHND